MAGHAIVGKDSGPWALFRLLDQMQVEQHSGRDVLLLKANLSGLQAKYLLHSQRSPNPFDAKPAATSKPGFPLAIRNSTPPATMAPATWVAT